MHEWPIIRDLIYTLNWLTITIPFIFAFGIREAVIVKTRSPSLGWIIGTMTFISIVGGLYLLYGVTRFPLWMSWFHV
jgi:hypothetical protein